MSRACLLALMLLITSLSATAELPAPVQQALQEAGIPQDAVSIFVQRFDRDTPLIAHRADEARNPASLMKLLTTYAGLELLGPAYTWHTDMLTTGATVGDTLHGDLILKGQGDPAMTLENFWDLVRALRKSGIRDIEGNLLLDRSYFEAQSHDPAAFDGEPYRAYNAGPDALLVNFKATRFVFHGNIANGKVAIDADPALPQLTLNNRLKLSQAPCNNWKDRLDYSVTNDGDNVSVSFVGDYALACGE